MCKLLVLSGNRESDVKALLELFVKSFGSKNPDGWGIAFLDTSTNLYHTKKFYHRDRRLLEEAFFKEIKKIETKSLLAHLRKASIGQKCLENCHPFENYIDGHQFVFMHNGSVWPRRIFESKLVNHKPKSSDPTDSELIFCYILDELEENGVNLNSWQDVVEAINETVLKIRSEALLTKLNFVLADKNYIYCYNYDELQYSVIYENPESNFSNKNQTAVSKDGKIVVCSKPYLENIHWQPIPKKTNMVLYNGEILRISK
ncbi:MAG: class II glutamine amidotransferase [Candidatus Jordarchaeaceae archaeon]